MDTKATTFSQSKEIQTKGMNGERNGSLFEILNINDDKEFLDDHSFQQIYMTTLRNKVLKGFHVHGKKTDNFFPVQGSVIVLVYGEKLEWGEQITEENFKQEKLEAIKIVTGNKMGIVKIPPGHAHGILNLEDSEARVCNYCYPAYKEGNLDQWEITDPFLHNHIQTMFPF